MAGALLPIPQAHFLASVTASLFGLGMSHSGAGRGAWSRRQPGSAGPGADERDAVRRQRERTFVSCYPRFGRQFDLASRAVLKRDFTWLAA